MTKRTWLPSILLALAVASCGGGSSSVSRAKLPEQFASAFCARITRCIAPGDASAMIATVVSHPGTQGGCEDLVARQGLVDFSSFDDAIAAGTIRYDGHAASLCLAALSNSCADFSVVTEIEPSCSEVYVGTVAVGGACSLDDECVGDAHCFTTPGVANCNGTCVANVAIGGACTSSSECSQAGGGVASCEFGGVSSRCVVTQYVTAAGGAACGETDPDGDERVTTLCGSNHYCKLTPGLQTGTCAEPIAVGQPCVADTDACVANALCAGTLGQRTCRAITVVETAGGACDDASLIICNPLSRLQCVASACASIGTGAAGQPCRSGFDTDCSDGLHCAHTTGNSGPTSCQAYIPNGQPCPNGDELCESGYCDDVANPGSPVCAMPLCGN